jgi:hypothetical protein
VRNAMGKRIIRKTGNLSVVQRQIGNHNVTSSYTACAFFVFKDGGSDRQKVGTVPKKWPLGAYL